MNTPVALTVAGSDSGGGAGIQADLKTFHACGVFGTTAITCITAQNPRRVSAVQACRPALVAAQMDRVFEAFPVAAAKTGMLFDTAIITAVAAGFRRQKLQNLVVDPVMVATSGARLLKRDAVAALTAKLFPLAALVTPNHAEVEVLLGKSVRDLRAAAPELVRRYGVPFLAKGGHVPAGGWVVDVFCDGRELHEFRARQVRGIRPHGAGCTLSAAITANLARGFNLVDSIRRARRLISHALREAIHVGRYRALKI
ncbi:MAG: bifunctional hydroxymethylpyrimidine kinase/phosphomethylpyrimidine kinase [Verrucomicrobiota bacterium]